VCQADRRTDTARRQRPRYAELSAGKKYYNATFCSSFLLWAVFCNECLATIRSPTNVRHISFTDAGRCSTNGRKKHRRNRTGCRSPWLLQAPMTRITSLRLISRVSAFLNEKRTRRWANAKISRVSSRVRKKTIGQSHSISDSVSNFLASSLITTQNLVAVCHLYGGR